MISTLSVLETLYRADPYGYTEPALRTELSLSLGSRTIGNGELADVLARLVARRWVVQTRNDDNDPIWGLTPDGRTECARRF